ncbi:unnamed protein product [Paramecium sonneborni]|uniref:Transmembrane protein n=1 Tax=Paramecium sonneborni TaxID=65129 RepID=A0A8S1RTA3_9CILI|nr:unnamed protein product [Paramecium sonneborni]
MKRFSITKKQEITFLFSIPIFQLLNIRNMSSVFNCKKFIYFQQLLGQYNYIYFLLHNQIILNICCIVKNQIWTEKTKQIQLQRIILMNFKYLKYKITLFQIILSHTLLNTLFLLFTLLF